MAEDVLDPGSKVLVTVEDPVFFEAMVRAWEAGGHTGHLDEAERCYKGDDDEHPDIGERTPAQRLEFASYIRDFGHQMDLERATRRPVISLALTPPSGFPAVPDDSDAPAVRGRHHTGAIQVTRRARELIESGPQPPVSAVAQPTEVIPVIEAQPTEVIPVIEAGEDANAPDDAPASGDD